MNHRPFAAFSLGILLGGIVWKVAAPSRAPVEELLEPVRVGSSTSSHQGSLRQLGHRAAGEARELLQGQRGALARILNNEQRRASYAQVIWDQSDGNLAQCLHLSLLIPGIDSYAVQQLLASRCLDMESRSLCEQLPGLLLGKQVNPLSRACVDVLRSRGDGLLDEYIATTTQTGTPSQKWCLTMALLEQDDIRPEAVAKALSISRGAPGFSNLLAHAAGIQSSDPTKVRQIFTDAGQGAEATMLKASSLQHCSSMPMLERTQLLGSFESAQLKKQTAFAIGLDWLGPMDEIATVAALGSPDAIAVCSSMTQSAWRRDPGGTSTALLKMGDADSVERLWDAVVRSWPNCATNEEAHQYLVRLKNLPPEANDALQTAITRAKLK